MKLLYLTIGLVLLFALAYLLFPYWWWIVFIPFFICLFFTSKFIESFGASFLSALLVWGSSTLWRFFNGGQIITERMRDLFGLEHNLYLLLIVILFGCMAASFSGMTGTALRTFFVKEQRRNYYY